MLGTSTVATDGSVALTTKVPETVPAGVHTVIITGTDNAGESATVSISLTVTAAANATSTATSSATASNSATASATTPATTKAGAAAGAGTTDNDLAHTGANAASSLFLALALLIAGGVFVMVVRRRGKRA